MTGEKLGHYEILDKIGEGGMGQVWRARDGRLNRSVAIKILPAEVAGDPARRQRFEQEARSLGALNHPNIVAVYDVGQSNGRAYIVSELVEGESLRRVMDRGPLTGRRLVEVATQIAEALAAAHALGIVHRDLKPENIMISGAQGGVAGRVKVLDFGLAKQNVAAAGSAVSLGGSSGAEAATVLLSQPGMVLGTVGYMSPEQVRGENVDARSDIFSFGCVLYEMATGKRAFEGGSAADVMSAVLREEPHEVPGAMTPAMEAIARRCLEKDPALRFQSAADLAFALRALATPTGSQTAIPAVAAAPPKRRRKPSHFIAAAMVGLAIFAGGYAARDRLSGGPAEFQRITFREGRVTNARLGPEGRTVICSATWEGGEPGIYTSTVGNPESRDLGLAGARLLAVSSKGDVAFLTGTIFPDGSGTLARASVTGGPPRELLEHVRFADFSPDGSEMAVVREVNGKGRIEYPIGKMLTETIFGPFGIRISPSGRQVAFTTYGGNGSVIAIYTVDRTGKVRKLGVVSGQTSGMAPTPLAWSRDGREIWFRSFDPNDRNTIYAIGMDGKRRVAARFPGDLAFYDLAADGRMLFSLNDERKGIRGLAPGATEERDLSVLEAADLRGISDDGSEILAETVGESGGTTGAIYLRRTDGSPPLRLGDGVAYKLSPDGKWVSGYTSRASAQRMFILMPTGPGETVDVHIPQLPNHGGGLVAGWLEGEDNYLVQGASVTGKGWQFFDWNARANTVTPASPPNAPDSMPLISPDRRSYLLPCGGGMWCIYPVSGGEPKPVPGLTPHDMPVNWRADGKAIYVMTHHNDNRMLPISLIDLATGQRTPWKELRASVPVDLLSMPKIAPDGRAYAYNYTYVRSELYVADGVK